MYQATDNPNLFIDLSVPCMVPRGQDTGASRDLEAWLAAGNVPAPLPVDLTAYAADKRFRVETGGIVVNGASIQTDRASQAMITGLYTYAAVAKPDSIPFKAEGGFVSLTSAQAVAVGLAVGAHVQACFVAEQAIDADIASGAITTVEQVEADGRWPASGT